MSFTWAARSLLRLIFVFALSACTTLAPTVGNEPQNVGLAVCCSNPERQPQWLVDLARPVAKPLGLAVSKVVWRKGYLYGQPQARSLIRAKLKPMDLLLVSTKGRLSGHTIPGLFGHAVIYLGSEQELRKAGVWGSPEFAPLQAAIISGQHFIEADWDGVHLSDENRVMNTDRVVILRPQIKTGARRQKALRDYAGAIGMPFDFKFDLDTPECTFCTELVRMVMPELNLPVTHVYDTHVVIPEAVVKAAHDGTSRLTIIAYVAGHKDGWSERSIRELAADIAAAWQ